jgi:pimeloyl-ACP methyl ester carboxylesterase
MPRRDPVVVRQDQVAFDPADHESVGPDADDLATPVEHQRLIAEAIPGARHEIVSPAAHTAAVEQADAVNRLIEEHLS